MDRTRRVARRGKGPPLYTYAAIPGALALSAVRIDREFIAGTPAAAHAHDFLALTYFERSGGAIWTGNRQWGVEAGDVHIIAPGEVVRLEVADDLARALGWTVFFPPEVLGPRAPAGLLSWRAHPLLFPYVRGATGGADRVRVPPGDRGAWSARMRALERELSERRDGYRDAALAQLTLLLVEIARLASDIAGELRLRDESLLAAVFGVIEERYREPISLADVAWAVGMSPGYLTTVVRRKTARTVVQWIAERRMAEARRLLVETDLAVEQVAHQVGYRDAGYFTRLFGRAHGTTPAGWRRAGRG